MNIIKKLELLINFLEKNSIDYKITHYILFHQEKILSMTIRQLANEIHVSPASIIRFFHKIGINEYLNFKKLLILENKENEEKKNKFGVYSLSNNNLYNDLYSSSMLINTNQISFLIKKIKKSKNIILYIEDGYLDILEPFISLLKSDNKKINNLTIKKEILQNNCIISNNLDNLILLIFPSKDYLSVSLQHRQLSLDIIDKIENATCPKIFIGQLNYIYNSFFYPLQIPYCKNYAFYKIIVILLVEQFIIEYKK